MLFTARHQLAARYHFCSKGALLVVCGLASAPNGCFVRSYWLPYLSSMLESKHKFKYKFEMVLLLENKYSIVLYITSYDPLFSVDAKQTIGTSGS